MATSLGPEAFPSHPTDGIVYSELEASGVPSRGRMTPKEARRALRALGYVFSDKPRPSEVARHDDRDR